MKKISNSLDWSPIADSLKSKSKNFAHYGEIRKMINNIGTQVTVLSNLEVECRRTGSTTKLGPLLAEINRDIEMVSDYILVAALIG
jgi:hypothetical protein